MLHSTHMLWSWTLLVALGSAYVIQSPGQQGNDTSRITSHLLDKRADDPADFSWVKRWAAVGDSFTAGIGSGRQLGKAYHRFNDWKCSRYDQAYPMVVNTFLGRTVQKFQYPACSGDRSEGIYKQVTETLEDNMDLVIMTAGGNDLCLVCILKPVPSQKHFTDTQLGFDDQEMRLLSVSPSLGPGAIANLRRLAQD